MVKSLPLALLIAAGLLSSTATASAYIVNGFEIAPYAALNRANLSYANLTNADLSYANLTNANLYGADLTNANLSNAYLSHANLYGADLSNAYLYRANLSNANLYGADLTNANLYRAYLYGADLSYATVSYSNWTDFSNNSGAQGLGSYSYDTSLINYAGSTPVPEPSTYGLIGIGALGVAFAARRRKLKTA